MFYFDKQLLATDYVGLFQLLNRAVVLLLLLLLPIRIRSISCDD